MSGAPQHRHGGGGRGDFSDVRRHAHGDRASERRLALAAALTGTFMVAELAGGLLSGSLALIADAGHMLTDFGGLALAWFGFRLARRPADWKRTYGFERFSVLVAFANALALFAIAAWIVAEAILRLREPVPVAGAPMLAVAAGGLIFNIVCFFVLRGSATSLNVRAAALHVMGDLLGSVAALGAAAVILATGWTPIDPLLSVLVALIILRSGWAVLRESSHILLEGTPAGLDVRSVRADLIEAVPGVEDVHHVHAWSISEERPMMTLHARLGEGAPAGAVAAIKSRLHDRFGVSHATVEVEQGDCADSRPRGAGA